MTRDKDKDKEPSLFDPVLGERGRDAGRGATQRAQRAIQDPWLDVIYEICRHNVTFTTDDVVRLAIDRAVPEPNEGRVMGAWMKEAAKRGWCWITKTDQKSERARLHRGNCRVWASNLAEQKVSVCSTCEGIGYTIHDRGNTVDKPQSG